MNHLVLEHEKDAKLFEDGDVGDSFDMQHLAKGLWIVAQPDPNALLAPHSDQRAAAHGDWQMSYRASSLHLLTKWNTTRHSTGEL
jgi:hypothetical protein